MAKTKIGLSLPKDADEELEALAFAKRTSKSEIARSGIEAVKAGLSADERRAFEAARAARGGA